VSPDLTMDTTSKNSVGVYVIGMFKEGSEDYSQFRKSHIKAKKFLKEYKNYIK